MTTKTKMLSTDSDSSSRYAAKYSVAALLPCVAATHSPSASPSPTHTMTHAMFRDEGSRALLLMFACLLQSTGTKSDTSARAALAQSISFYTVGAPLSPIAPTISPSTLMGKPQPFRFQPIGQGPAARGHPSSR